MLRIGIVYDGQCAGCLSGPWCLHIGQWKRLSPERAVGIEMVWKGSGTEREQDSEIKRERERLRQGERERQTKTHTHITKPT